MQAVFDLAPSGPIAPVLRVIAATLVEVNVIWLRAQLDRGLDPPCCTACAAPPWTAGGGVDYVPYHGSAAKGVSRRYIDGPTMFAEGRATCLDAAAYDAACLLVKERTAAWVDIVPIDDNGGFHALVVLPDGSTRDPAAELVARPLVNVGAVRSLSGAIVRHGTGHLIGADLRSADATSSLRRRQLSSDIRASNVGACVSCGGGR